MMDRRNFLSRSAGLMAAAALPASALSASAVPPATATREAGIKLKLGLNAFSFDGPLRKGSMTLMDAVHFCARQQVDALDATGYYFPGYPKAPSGEL